eukprot:CAMPEP_0171471172 /NCGR_PEP_ID=MMETSP0946-20130122/551_1 /TAXON_ID=109269 /ORGANISM="Vaucheria litorea, Strain CCMP2940" /LENGTH=626 /DNA_ID=CAMNT_0012000621 /DNA_START=306 /DNA_END=2183 /DNA_ORIENTATION=+
MAQILAENYIDLNDLIESKGAEEALIIFKKSGGGAISILHKNIFKHKNWAAFLKNLPITIHIVNFNNPSKESERKFLNGKCKYTLVFEEKMLDEAKLDLTHLVKRARKPHPSKEDIKLDMGENTFFLSLTFPELKPHSELLSKLVQGSDAMELRVDLLGDRDPYNVLRQMQFLRRKTQNLPIIFTVRSKGQCGNFEDDPESLFELVKWGLRGGAEYLDIEMNWEMKYRMKIINLAKKSYPSTVLIGSYHIVGQKKNIPEIKKLFKRCCNNGKVDAVKVVTTAFEESDSYKVHLAAEESNLHVPYIALCLSPKGVLSRVLNKRFTPVTHQLLPFVAAPGQLTTDQIMNSRKALNILTDKKFYIFGFPISASPSPNMHNGGFEKFGLPYTFERCESESTEKMENVLKRDDFGGASVTIPHKQNVIQFLDEVSEVASEIGAVNTVIVKHNEKTGKKCLFGENTDWLGIYRPIKSKFVAKKSKNFALIVGAGGAAMSGMYAMKKLGLELLVYNRTAKKAQELAQRFGGTAIEELSSDCLMKAVGQEFPDVVISTVPGSSGFKLPVEFLKHKPIVFDAAYKPAKTALLEQAVENECPFVQGAEMLVEQGIEQFQLWTKRRAPKLVMSEAVY